MRACLCAEAFSIIDTLSATAQHALNIAYNCAAIVPIHTVIAPEHRAITPAYRATPLDHIALDAAHPATPPDRIEIDAARRATISVHI